MSRKSLVSLMVLLAIAAVPVLAQDRMSESRPHGVGVGFPESQPAPFPQGPIAFYGDRPTFDAAHPGLPCEDWEEFVDAINGCDAPANSTTSCIGYNVGDILPGLEIDCATNSGPGGNGLVIIPTGFDGNPSITFGSNFFNDNTIVNLSPAVRAIGMDIQCHFGSPSVDIQVFDDLGALVATTSSACATAGTFLGIDSTSPNGIGSVTINDPSDVSVETLDDVCFGELPIPVELTGFDVE